MSDFKPGLEGVIAFETEIAEPDKEGGSLRYRGVDIEELVGHVSYGHVWGLLVDNAFAPGLPAQISPETPRPLSQPQEACCQMIWPVPDILAYLSQLYTLQPGDLIFTGTPEGVGAVVAGDRIEGHIAGVGEITLHVVAAE